LINRLGSFSKKHPNLDIRLASQNQIDDLGNVIGEEGPNWVDLRIRYGRGKWPGLHITKLFDEEVFPVCSPDLIQPGKPVASLDDLANYTLIHDDMQMSWESWVRSVGYSQAISSRGPKFSHSHMALQAAVNSEGIVLGRSVLTLDFLKTGQLAAIFHEHF
jgi:LysR family glycine cleavage system transcriptional activator